MPAHLNTPEAFIDYWSKAEASERSTSQHFLVELTQLLGVPQPDHSHHDGYSFEFPVKVPGSSSTNFIDLYRRNHFVLESKKFIAQREELTQLQLAAVQAGAVEDKKKTGPVRGTGAWDDAMFRAKNQAERYVRCLPAEEPNPPFLIVCDVGHSFEVYADFTQNGKAYQAFPDPRTFRIKLQDLEKEEIRERLRLIWTNPAKLDPTKVSAEVTREIAGYLAELAKSLEKEKHDPEVVAQFLTRCLFCMFAEDVGLLPEHSFTSLLKAVPEDGTGFPDLLGTLFKEMNTGTGKSISVILRKKLLRFNGGLFADHTVLPVNGLQLGLLKQAAKTNWSKVEPAIFGTLLERALNPQERHALGAHFTPRAYVERLVLPTVIDPLKQEWQDTQTAAVALRLRADTRQAQASALRATSSLKQKAGDTAAAQADFKAATDAERDSVAAMREASAEIHRFHDKLCRFTVLDPACGSGNFLYVSLELMKRLEGEVIDFAAQFGTGLLDLSTHTVDPHQFLGIEINPRAAAIAELVLWIGYLQWHFRTRGEVMPEEPVLKSFKNIEHRDAVLEYDGDPVPAQDESGHPITVWDRRSYKPDLVTNRNVPDESKRVPLYTYTNPRPAKWPQADCIVGNPPFIGKVKLREDLGDGYAETLRAAYPQVPDSADFVLYWWHKAAELVRLGKAERFGLITTNSLRQTFARRVVQAQLSAKPPLSLSFVVADHPWVDTKDGAAVRIAMTVGVMGETEGELFEILDEKTNKDGSVLVTFHPNRRGRIFADLTIGADVAGAIPLKANEGMTSMGVMLAGRGFVIEESEAISLEAGQDQSLEKVFRPLRNGKDLLDEPRQMYVVDFTGLSLEQARSEYPTLFQILLTRVKPERDANRDVQFRDKWWLFGRSRPEMRAMVEGLRRYIATVETAKHRLFHFVDCKILPEHRLIVFGTDDAFMLGVLSSRIHVFYSLLAGGTLEDRPVYNKSRCFDPFPFPLCNEAQKDTIRALAEELDAHRKRVQAQHGLTLTGLYNVLEKLRSGEALTEKEKLIHDKGLVSILKQLHDDLDAAVFAAYGWPATLTDAEILERLVALNAQRAAEEKRGIIHWLRPEYQNPPDKAAATQGTLNLSEKSRGKKAKAGEKQSKASSKKKAKTPWPKSLAERIRATEQALHATAHPVAATELAGLFARASGKDLQEILETLVAMGRARQTGEKFGI